jgi:hypothetical protein
VPTGPGNPTAITIRMGTEHRPSKVLVFTTDDTKIPQIDTEEMSFQGDRIYNP